MSKLIFKWLTALVILVAAAQICEAAERSLRVYVGTYTGPKSKGIYLYNLDLETGALTEAGLAVETHNPSFLAISPDGNHVYAVGDPEEVHGKKVGMVSAFSVDSASGKLTFMNHQPSGGDAPCHITTDSTGKHVFVANYTSGTIASFPVESDGKLGTAASVIQHHGKGPDAGRQEGPHAHGIWPSPDDRFVITCDLGLDKVLVYKLDPASGKLTANDPPSGSVPPGAGARHAAFSRDGKFVYAINEMGNTMTAFAWDAQSGALKDIQSISTIPEGYKEKTYCSEVIAHPGGKFVYGSNRGHDSLAVFSADPSSGMLTLVDITPVGGKWPRAFNIEPSGKWLIAANERSDNLTVFKIDPETGKLTQTGAAVASPSSPVCVMFAPPGKN